MAKRFYDSHQWQRLRKIKLSTHPLCEECLSKGIAEVATEVDHIKPIAEGGSATALSNLQSLSKKCHSKKTRRENAKTKDIVTTLAFMDEEIKINKYINKKNKGSGGYQHL